MTGSPYYPLSLGFIGTLLDHPNIFEAIMMLPDHIVNVKTEFFDETFSREPLALCDGFIRFSLFSQLQISLMFARTATDDDDEMQFVNIDMRLSKFSVCL